MNKDEIQTGDLVRLTTVAGLDNGVGLVIEVSAASTRFVLRYRVLWFNAGSSILHSRRYLAKLEIPSE
jgi:hypothetical protein